ncbi:hypothetical protein BD410DRAFT_901052 [Rickenella mellea]|uniref:RING-type domain-containing protein n=1 Tax=Rickenella mellea TaxID=50990 RepID=A0A4Y7PSU9_9AGAM|nr:hypothetical protein BD410DRAFT_901052 [Rickenella mellea]
MSGDTQSIHQHQPLTTTATQQSASSLLRILNTINDDQGRPRPREAGVTPTWGHHMNAIIADAERLKELTEEALGVAERMAGGHGDGGVDGVLHGGGEVAGEASPTPSSSSGVKRAATPTFESKAPRKRMRGGGGDADADADGDADDDNYDDNVDRDADGDELGLREYEEVLVVEFTPSPPSSPLSLPIGSDEQVIVDGDGGVLEPQVSGSGPAALADLRAVLPTSAPLPPNSQQDEDTDTPMDVDTTTSPTSSTKLDKGKGKALPPPLTSPLQPGPTSSTTPTHINVDGDLLSADLAQELQCGCCAELVYKPVLVSPCQHFFCGSCCTLWIRNGGTSCPACRSPSTAVTPSRALQAMVDVLLRAAPHRQRAEGERVQADRVYIAGRSLRIPPPKSPSPEPSLPPPTLPDVIYPCPHCAPGNVYGWTCPVPVPDPNVVGEGEGAWRVEDGTPTGHGYCGNCEVLLALPAPTTSTCSLCHTSFCGLSIPTRCSALPLLSQHPHALEDVGDLVQSPDVYAAFDGNAVEVEGVLDYMGVQGLGGRGVYREIVAHIQAQPRGFEPLIEQDLFVDVHGVPPSNPIVSPPIVNPPVMVETGQGPGDDVQVARAGGDGASVGVGEGSSSAVANGDAGVGVEEGDWGTHVPSQDIQSQPSQTTPVPDSLPPSMPTALPALAALATEQQQQPQANQPPQPQQEPQQPPPPEITRICRVCASEVLLWGLRDWWIRERQKGFVDAAILAKPDCVDGRACVRQGDTAHAKEFNHIIAPPGTTSSNVTNTAPSTSTTVPPLASASAIASALLAPRMDVDRSTEDLVPTVPTTPTSDHGHGHGHQDLETLNTGVPSFMLNPVMMGSMQDHGEMTRNLQTYYRRHGRDQDQENVPPPPSAPVIATGEIANAEAEAERDMTERRTRTLPSLAELGFRFLSPPPAPGSGSGSGTASGSGSGATAGLTGAATLGTQTQEVDTPQREEGEVGESGGAERWTRATERDVEMWLENARMKMGGATATADNGVGERISNASTSLNTDMNGEGISNTGTFGAQARTRRSMEERRSSLEVEMIVGGDVDEIMQDENAKENENGVARREAEEESDRAERNVVEDTLQGLQDVDTGLAAADKMHDLVGYPQHQPMLGSGSAEVNRTIEDRHGGTLQDGSVRYTRATRIALGDLLAPVSAGSSSMATTTPMAAGMAMDNVQPNSAMELEVMSE